MAKSTASAPAPSPDILGFDEPGPAGDKEEGLDLEAYLDLEESPDITRLVQNLQGEAGASAGREDGPPAAAESSRPPLGTPAPGEPGQTTATAAPTETGAPRRASVSRAAQPPLELEAVAHALGEVQVQGRQVVVVCPACGGRPAIIVYANRFKCFGCDAAGDEAALVALLTGWDDRRVARWLAAAREAMAEHEPEAGRRPWRLSLFTR